MDIVTLKLATKIAGNTVSFDSLTPAQVASLKGSSGADGVGITSIALSDNKLVFTMTDSTTKEVTLPAQVYYSEEAPADMADGTIWIKKEAEAVQAEAGGGNDTV